MPPQNSSSKSSIQFYPGQKEFAGQLFDPGGLFQTLLGGGPNPGLERQISRGQDNLTAGLAQQGLTGSGLAAKSLTGYQTQAAGQRQDNLVETMLNAIRPAGSVSVGRSKPFPFGV